MLLLVGGNSAKNNLEKSGLSLYGAVLGFFKYISVCLQVDEKHSLFVKTNI